MEEKIKGFYHYGVRLKNKKIDFTALEKNEKGKMGKVKSFESPVTKNKLFKIYIVKHEANIVYVGFTSQSISNRLRQGLKPRAESGYYGYQWKKLIKIDLFIICFDKTYTRKKVEGIEGEIVYLIRNETDNWPKYQTEIHFHNIPKREKDLVNSIYEEIKNL